MVLSKKGIAPLGKSKNRSKKMKNRVLKLIDKVKTEGCRDAEIFADEVRGAELRDNGFTLDTEKFLFIVEFRGNDMFLVDLAGEGEDNDPLLWKLGINKKELEALAEGEPVEIYKENRFAYLLAVGLEKAQA